MVNIIELETAKSFITAKNFSLFDSCEVFADTRTISREEWLKNRRSGIGGSDTSAILGLSKYKTELSLWVDKVSEEEPIEEQSEAAFWGTTMEPIIREEYSRRHPGEEVFIFPFMLRSKAHPFMIADLDGLVYRSGEWCGLEIKTSSEYIRDSWGDENEVKIPLYYQTQVQHYMAVTGLKKFIFVVLIGGNRYVERVIEASEAVQDRIIAAESDFWDKVMTRTRPELDGSDYSTAYVNSKFTGSDASVLDLSGETDLVEKYVEAKQVLDSAKEAVKDAETELEGYKNRIKEHMGNHTNAVCGGFRITYKTKNTGVTVDAKALKADYPDIYGRYAKEKKPSYLLNVIFEGGESA